MKAVGIDGCRYGWVTACYNDGKVLIFKNINDVIKHYGDAYSFLIDIPIGLVSEKNNVRNCEKTARAVLPANRKSSVFSIPCREALTAANYAEANGINRQIMDCGISKQTWFILPKIKELDDVLINDHNIRLRFKESHPEIAFQFLNGGSPLLYSKKTADGATERLAILMRYNEQSESLYTKALIDYKRLEVAKDDILDALCLALTQNLLLAQPDSYKVNRFASNPLLDEHGIEMAIYYSKYKHSGLE
ncbi:DUF429 domain-containing protein [Flavobacterium rivuli]|uniref:DUF429 domain-containing protein n=1 Tax=Flavobacterium rivuli TaxID=498301 RepID=UPI00037A117C|nr:DUF429 domain-containing protein [Flavobacterium rivuli]